MRSPRVFGWLATAPFRRAPWLLFRRPILVVAMVGTAVILGMVGSMTPLFQSSAASAGLQRELEGRCRSSFAATLPAFGSFGPSLSDDLESTREVLRSVTTDDPAFDDPTLILRGATLDAARAGSEASTEVQVIGLEDFEPHVELVAGVHGDGAYIDQRTADDLGAGPGDRLDLTIVFFTSAGQEEISTQVTVAAVFDDINDDYLDPYWCTIQDALAPSPFGDLPPAPLLVHTSEFRDDAELFHIIFGVGHEPGQWHVPLQLQGLTVTGAYRAVETIEAANEDLGHRLDEAIGAPVSSDFDLRLESDLLPVTERLTAQIDALETSILPLATVVLLAAVGLIGAAGSYWVDRRRSELELLSTQGVPPWAIAIKAALELLLPVVIGASLGWAIGNLVIGLAGPSPDIETFARIDGLYVALASAGAGLVAAALVAGVRARGLLDVRPGSSRELSLRWPLIVVSAVAAYLVRSRIGEQAVTLRENEVVGSVDPMVLFFPILVLISAVLLVSELVTLTRPLIRRLGGRSHAGFIASRRVLSAPSVALALLAGAAVPVAILIYSANLARSATVSIDAKGKTSIGSDVSTLLYRVEDLPTDFAGNSTIVVKFERARLNGDLVDVLAVDPETFAEGGFWLDTYADRPLGDLLASLQRESAGGALPALVANAPAESGEVDSDGGDFAVEVVTTADAFPGSVRDRPLVVVDRDRLHALVAPDEERMRGGRYLLWTTGLTEREIEESLGAADIGFAFTTAADTTLDQLKFAVIVWTFEFLRLYAALAGLIVIASVLIYTDTRQRARSLSYALARRMGLERRDHLVAGFVEVGSLAGVGTLTGIVVGRWASRDLFLALDPLPDTPPGPQWVGATDLTLLVLAAVVGLAGVSAWLAQRTADNADVSELLRHGG